MDPIDRTVLPMPDPEFKGKIGRTIDASKPDWSMQAPVRPPLGAPNVLLVLIDDAGFGNPETFGGPVATPNLTRTADAGLRYNRFHVTAVCSPTRAATLTGRNHHTVGFGSLGELPGPFPGYSAALPKSCAPVAKTLQMNGYVTSAFGKWHLTPDHVQGPAGPFDRWPNAWGFDYFWGFLGGEAGQFDPMITENNTTIGVPEDEDFYFPDAMADKAIEWLDGVRAQDEQKPFFMYFSTGCAHAPHHVPLHWADKYAGRFDEGWDRYREETLERQKKLGVVPEDTELTPRPDEMPAWDSLTDEQRKLYARQMEVYAGYQENADYNVGRVLDALEELGDLDDTLVIYIWGDNGASMEGTLTGGFNELIVQNGISLTEEEQLEKIEAYGGLDAWGGPLTAPHYSSCWGWAGNAPFQWGKQLASYLGGTRNPMAISWPRRINDRGGLREQFTHCIDLAPTILEVAGIPEPVRVNGIEQKPLEGTSFAHTFTDAGAEERHTRQYFESFGYHGMYKEGWWASCKPFRLAWDVTHETLSKFAPGLYDPDTEEWELYYLPDDFSQARDIAAENPEKLEELKAAFWEDAERYNVLPMLGAYSVLFGILPPMVGRTKFNYRPGVQNIASGMIPRIYGHSYSISADLVVPDGGVDGVIVAEADHLGGFALFVDDGVLKHTYSTMGVYEYTQEASEPLPPGEVNVRMEFAIDEAQTGAGGQATLFVNDSEVGSGRIDRTVSFRFNAYAGMDIGRDNGLVVDRSYEDRAPFPFTGEIKKVTFDLKPHLTTTGEEHEELELELHQEHQRMASAHASTA